MTVTLHWRENWPVLADPARMVEGASRLLVEVAAKGSAVPNRSNPYGDGRAAERIAKALAWKFGLCPKPQDWDNS